MEISFKDEGTGIPDSLLPKVFDPFFTTKDAGSGLGLATCYSIIRKHNGMITVKSQMGKGTTITIFLHASEKEAVSKTEQPATAGTLGGRALVMDDEEFMRDVAEGMLELLGFEVVSTRNGEEAVEVFRKEHKAGKRFDLVLLDLTIHGGMGGEQTMSEILKIDSKVLGIVASGYADSPVLSHPVKYGFAGKIEKPYRKADLSRIIESVFMKE